MANPKDVDDEEIKLPDEEEGTDAGLDDDEGGDEAEAGQEPEAAEAEEGLEDEPPQRSRATRAVQEAKRTARESAARAQALEAEVAQLRAERAAREAAAAQPKEETPEQEAQKLASMTIEERLDYRLAKSEARHAREIGLANFRSADMADRATYEAKASSDPRRKRLANEVEQLLTSERRAGRDFPRDTIYYFLLGQKVEQGGAARDKAARAGAQRIQRQTARADSGRSDRAAPRRGESDPNSIAALEKRLSGVYI
jgi:hypothetical protein